MRCDVLPAGGKTAMADVVGPYFERFACARCGTAIVCRSARKFVATAADAPRTGTEGVCVGAVKKWPEMLHRTAHQVLKHFATTMCNSASAFMSACQ